MIASASSALSACTLSALLVAPAAAGPGFWPTFADETGARLVASPAIGLSDTQEKDYAWGDVDQDGDVDLVCVRKQPWNTEGRFRNVLFMNEGLADGHALDGVLVDRSVELASASAGAGSGFLDLTNDRDVALIDLDGDGWLDVVTATTYGAGLPAWISHPRVYVNLGEDDGVWQGFRFEPARTPIMPITPNFCGVGVGDVDGDGDPDLYFVDYNNDLEDRLWINDGSGSFADESETRLTAAMRFSDFGVHAVIADMNGDGAADIVKDRASTTTTPPLRIQIMWNDETDDGVFDTLEILYDGNPYHVEVGDLNGDGRLDIVADDDGLDRYFLNLGNGADGHADFAAYSFPPASGGFGGNIVIRDVNRDGHEDVVIADVDVDCCGCERHMHFWRNTGTPPSVAFVEESGGIPIAARTGTHDVAIFDLDGDGWDDFVIGTCTGMSIWIAQADIAFTYVAGSPPQAIPAGEAVSFDVTIEGVGGAQVDPASAALNVSVAGGPYSQIPLAPLGGTLYRATLPALACLQSVAYYLSVESVQGLPASDPPGAPAQTYFAIADEGTVVVSSDDLEDDVSGWQVVNDPGLASGAWEAADPNATVVGNEIAAPDDDATPPPGVIAFVTENGLEGGAAGANDVDGGPTYLVSPLIDLSGGDATISFARWFYCNNEGEPGGDALLVDVSDDGGASWTPVTTVPAGGTGGAWQTASFVVGDHVTPTAAVRVRFTANDTPNDSITEAGIDDFEVRACAADCPADFDGNDTVDFNDLLSLLGSWGPCPACPQDLDGSGAVGFADLLVLLAAWGDCP